MVYLIKINVALILLYGFYKLIFANDTFFTWKRAILIGIYILAMLVPSLNFSYWVSTNAEMTSMASSYANYVLPSVTITPEKAHATSWQTVFIWTYSLVVAALLLKLLWQLTSIFLLKRKCRETEINGTRICQLPGDQGPFSFFNWIFVNPARHNGKELKEILIHEQTHCRQKHSLDILFAELFGICFWLNPFAWLLKREVRINLEFIADNRTLATGFDSKQYQYHLLGLTYKKNVATVSNNFNVSPLKKRIKMMNKKRTKAIGKAKYALFVPLIAALLLVSNIETVAREMTRTVNNIPELSGLTQKVSNVFNKVQTEINTTTATKTVAPLPTDSTTEAMKKVNEEASRNPEEVFNLAEVMPTFPGNINVWIMKNMKYPEQAVKQKQQGRVIVKFIVSETGEISNPEIIRGVSPLLDAEALRVVKAMPKWNPGKQNGKAVRTNYAVPITFRLEGGEQAKENTAMPAKKNILYVIDGKEYASGEYDINKLDLNQIESMTVLKGQQAVDKYGDRAKDGAIVFQLKK